MSRTKKISEIRKELIEFQKKVKKDQRASKDSYVWSQSATALRFGVRKTFVRTYTADIVDESVYVDIEVGTWVDESGSLYISVGQLIKRLGLSKATINGYLKKANVPKERLFTTDKNHRVQTFYPYHDALRMVPAFRRKIKTMKRINSLTNGNFLVDKPKKLTDAEYRLFVELVACKVNLDSWPTNTELVARTKAPLPSVRTGLKDLERKGYLTPVFKSMCTGKPLRQFIIHKGPKELLMRQVKYPGSDELFWVDRCYVERKDDEEG